jgi:hypothetical protein
MKGTKEKRAPEAQGDETVVLMYPDNQLKDQVRNIEDTLSAFDVLRREFFDKK